MCSCFVADMFVLQRMLVSHSLSLSLSLSRQQVHEGGFADYSELSEFTTNTIPPHAAFSSQLTSLQANTLSGLAIE